MADEKTGANLTHFDDAGRIVSIEVLHASKTLSNGALSHLKAAAESFTLRAERESRRTP